MVFAEISFPYCDASINEFVRFHFEKLLIKWHKKNYRHKWYSMLKILDNLWKTICSYNFTLMKLKTIEKVIVKGNNTFLIAMKSLSGWTIAKYLSTVIDMVTYTDPVLATATNPLQNGIICTTMFWPYLKFSWTMKQSMILKFKNCKNPNKS